MGDPLMVGERTWEMAKRFGTIGRDAIQRQRRVNITHRVVSAGPAVMDDTGKLGARCRAWLVAARNGKTGGRSQAVITCNPVRWYRDLDFWVTQVRCLAIETLFPRRLAFASICRIGGMENDRPLPLEVLRRGGKPAIAPE